MHVSDKFSNLIFLENGKISEICSEIDATWSIWIGRSEKPLNLWFDRYRPRVDNVGDFRWRYALAPCRYLKGYDCMRRVTQADSRTWVRQDVNYGRGTTTSSSTKKTTPRKPPLAMRVCVAGIVLGLLPRHPLLSRIYIAVCAPGMGEIVFRDIRL